MSWNIAMCPVVMTVSHFRLTKVLPCSSVPLGSCGKRMETQGERLSVSIGKSLGYSLSLESHCRGRTWPSVGWTGG